MRLGTIFLNGLEFDWAMTELLPQLEELGRRPCSTMYQRHFELFDRAVNAVRAVVRDLPELEENDEFVTLVWEARLLRHTLVLHNRSYTGEMPFELQENFARRMISSCFGLVRHAGQRDLGPRLRSVLI